MHTRKPITTSLHEAAKAGDISSLKRLLTQDTSLLNQYDRKGFTPLMYAVRSQHVEVINLLLRKGALSFTPSTPILITLAQNSSIKSLLADKMKQDIALLQIKKSTLKHSIEHNTALLVLSLNLAVYYHDKGSSGKAHDYFPKVRSYWSNLNRIQTDKSYLVKLGIIVAKAYANLGDISYINGAVDFLEQSLRTLQAAYTKPPQDQLLYLLFKLAVLYVKRSESAKKSQLWDYAIDFLLTASRYLVQGLELINESKRQSRWVKKIITVYSKLLADYPSTAFSRDDTRMWRDEKISSLLIEANNSFNVLEQLINQLKNIDSQLVNTLYDKLQEVKIKINERYSAYQHLYSSHTEKEAEKENIAAGKNTFAREKSVASLVLPISSKTNKGNSFWQVSSRDNSTTSVTQVIDREYHRRNGQA